MYANIDSLNSDKISDISKDIRIWVKIIKRRKMSL